MTGLSRYLRCLAGVPAFSGLDLPQLQKLYSFCSLKVLAKGETATVAGASVDELGIVVFGRLGAMPCEDAGIEIGQGQSVEAEAFFKQTQAATTRIALRETLLLTVSRGDLMAAFSANPDLLAACFSAIEASGLSGAPGSSSPSRIFICPAGVQGHLDLEIREALLSSFESLGEVRVLGRTSFGGGMPGAITLDAPQTSHWLQEQELEFDLTAIVADEDDVEFSKVSIEEADEILFVASGGDVALSPLEQIAVEARGVNSCRLVIPKGKGITAKSAAAWSAARSYRSVQAVDFGAPDSARVMAKAILGKGHAVATTSAGVHAAAIMGALQALEANGFPPVGLVAAGSAVLPAGLLASGSKLAEAEAVFRELSHPALWKRAPRPEVGLFDAGPIDTLLGAAFPGRDISYFERAFAAVSRSLSSGVARVQSDGQVQSAIRAGILPAGLLPPLVLEDGTILVTGENETEALRHAANKLSPSPLIFLYPSTVQLGPSSMRYRQLTGGSPFRLTAFQSHAETDKRVRIETVLGSLSAVNNRDTRPLVFPVPIPGGVMPMDWSQWALLRDSAYEWMSDQIKTKLLEG